MKRLRVEETDRRAVTEATEGPRRRRPGSEKKCESRFSGVRKSGKLPRPARRM